MLAALSSVAHIVLGVVNSFQLQSFLFHALGHVFSPSWEGFFYWYHDLFARYLSLPALVYILVCAVFFPLLMSDELFVGPHGRGR